MRHSWDLFDTLIGRKCGTATHLHEIMGELLQIPDFVERRQKAERSLQNRNVEYSLNDIYASYESMYGSCPGFAALEWQLEIENVFPIKRNVAKLHPDDIIVSDMYLSKEQLLRLMQKAEIWAPREIFVSCYGKHKGEIWKSLKGTIISHCGDNRNTDLTIPTQYGIRTRTANTELSNLEREYMKYSKDLSWWARQNRLEQIVDESHLQKLDTLQIELNIPLLWAACHILREYVERRSIQKLLFMSRDGHMFYQMFRALYPDVHCEYLYISRECLRGNSQEYFDYLNERYNPNTALVDMASSCGSLKIALPNIKHQNPKIWTLVFLPGFNVDTRGIDLTYVTTNIETKINNTWLEMLNYATHWHVAGIKNNEPFFDQIGEYDMNLVLRYHGVFEQMIKDVPNKNDVISYKALIARILPLINMEGRFLQQVFPGHLQFEARRKKTFVEVR